jgi:hypothetical protein
MARFLDISVPRFEKRYCRQVFSRVSLIEYGNGDCVFYGSEGCKVYPVRPVQCQTFPFWPHVMKTRREWESLKDRCPGVGTGKMYGPREIRKIMEGRTST